MDMRDEAYEARQLAQWLNELKYLRGKIEQLTHWVPVSEKLPEDGVYLVYAPDYKGGSSTAKERYDGVMFSKCRKGKWSIEHGYYARPNCVKAWMPIPVYDEGDDE